MDGRRSPTEANQYVALDFHKWLESVEDRAHKSLHRKPPTKPTIFRVPTSLRCGNLHAYVPKQVSIGPYHRGNSDLKAMEELKWRLLHNFLSEVQEGSKNEGLRKMRDLEKQARDRYSEVIDLDSDQFVEMMLLDGCFLIHILSSAYVGDKRLQAGELKSLLLGNARSPTRIFQDLLLLENQLPYFIIEHLLDVLGMPGRYSSFLQEVALVLFADFLPQHSNRPTIQLPEQVSQVDHLLHLFHIWILSVPKLEKVSNTRSFYKLSPELLSPILTRINKARDYLSKVLPYCSKPSLSEELPLSVSTMTELEGKISLVRPFLTELSKLQQSVPSISETAKKLPQLAPGITELVEKLSLSVPSMKEFAEKLSLSAPTMKELAEKLLPSDPTMTQLLMGLPLPVGTITELQEMLPRYVRIANKLLEGHRLSVPTMTELVEAGVKIKVRKANSFLDISFCKDKGVLEIPAIEITDSMNALLANLIAWEQSCPTHGMDVTFYTMFLNDIINTPRDVELLHQEEVIHRGVGDDQDIASLFSKLGKNVALSLESRYLNDVYKDLITYCRSRLHRWRAKAMHDYFNNPWAIISLGAGILLLGLAMLQSVYTALDYYKK